MRAASLALSLAVLSASAATSAEAQSLPAAEIPVCTLDSAAYKAWREHRMATLGVHITDSSPYVLPSARNGDACDGPVDFSADQDGRARDGIHGWVAASRCKETLCWAPRDFDPNLENSFLSGEYDTNNNVVPPAEDDPFIAKLERFQCFEPPPDEASGRKDDLAMEGAGLCFDKPEDGWLMHVEVTPTPGPVRRALVGQWREDKGSNGQEPEGQPKYDHWRRHLWDGRMCVHGPFVADTGHGAKAEIHPTELLWWNLNHGAGDRGLFAPDGPFDLVVVQDASARYNREHQYWVETEFPEERVWRPWAQAPLTGSFEIPFWSDEEPPCFTVGPFEPLVPGRPLPPARDCRASERGASATQRAGSVPAKKVPDPPLVKVVDIPLDARDKLEAKAEWVCRCTDETCGDKHRGYLGRLLVTAKVGVDRDFEEGAVALRVTDERLPFVPVSDAAPAAAVVPAPEKAALTGRLKGQIRWIPEKTPNPERTAREERGKETVGPASAGAGPAIAAAVKALFAEAGWPDSVAFPPVAGLWRPDVTYLEPRSRLSNLDDKTRTGAKTWVSWGKIEACPVPADPGRRCLDRSDAGHARGDRRQLRLPLDPSDRPYVVTAKASWSVRLPTGRTLEDEVEQHFWTHSFSVDATSIAEWRDAVTRLCGREATPEDKELFRLRGVLEGSVANGRVSVTTVALLVRETARTCGAATRRR
jgi:hypothetical protein